jgi:IS5 family transposase
LVALLAEVLAAIPEPQRTERQQDRLELLHGALARSENHGKQNVKKDDLLSDVDPDARRACKKRGKQAVAGYKEQLAVDADSHFVTHVEVQRGNTDDSEALEPVVAGHEANVGRKPEEAVTDSKYQSGVNRAYLVGEGILDSIAVPSAKGSKQGKFSTLDFALEFGARGRPTVALCPGGQLAEDPKWKGETHSWLFHFKKAQCEGCSLRARCSKQARGRQLSVDEHYQLTEQARVRQASPEGQAAQIARLGIEREFSHQQRHGGKRTRYRGLSKNRAWGWAWAAFLNIRRLTTLAWERASRMGVANLDRRGRLLFPPGWTGPRRCTAGQPPAEGRHYGPFGAVFAVGDR